MLMLAFHKMSKLGGAFFLLGVCGNGFGVLIYLSSFYQLVISRLINISIFICLLFYSHFVCSKLVIAFT